MLVKMLHTVYGSEDAYAIKRFIAGETYTIASSLALVLISRKHAEKVL